MPDCGTYYLIYSAVRQGKLKIVRRLINHYDVCRSPLCDEKRYNLLLEATKYNYTEIVKLLLTKCSVVNNTNINNTNATLHFAVEHNNIEVVRMLLNARANINAKNIDGMTPFHIAVERGNLEIIHYLLRYVPVNFGYKRKDGVCTPLQIAVERKHEEVIYLLLRYGSDINIPTDDGTTILYLAVKSGHPRIVESILKYNPDRNNDTNRNILSFAVGNLGSNNEIVELLLQYGFTVNYGDFNNNNNNYKLLLYHSIANGYLMIINESLKYVDVNMEMNGTTLLHIAIMYEQEKITELLINYGADVNAKDACGKTPLFNAIWFGNFNIFKLLLNKKADINNDPEYLIIALEQGYREIAEVLLQLNISIPITDKYGVPVLHLAALTPKMVEVAELLIKKGVDINAVTKYGVTTLHVATGVKNAKVVEVLLRHNVDVNLMDDNDTTPLHLSVLHGNSLITKMLLNKGANINAKRCNEYTALFIAVEEGHTKLVEILLKYGADVKSKIKYDRTPLLLAIQKKKLTVIETLLKFGANVNDRDLYGKTALHIACCIGQPDIIQILLEYGSDVDIIDKNGYTALDCVQNRSHVSNHSVKFNYEIFTKHLTIKLKTANLYVSQKILKFFNDHGMHDFQNKCEEEITWMKNEKIGNTRISYYDILTKCVRQLAMYARNEEIVQVLTLNAHETKCSVYGTMINKRFLRGKERREMLDQSNNFFHLIFNDYPKLHECTDKIVSYLNEKDLNVLRDL